MVKGVIMLRAGVFVCLSLSMIVCLIACAVWHNISTFGLCMYIYIYMSVYVYVYIYIYAYIR